MISLKRLKTLAAKSDMDGLRWDRDKNGHIYQGSYLGDSLVTLGDTYETSQEDCEYVEALLEAAPGLIRLAEASCFWVVKKDSVYLTWHLLVTSKQMEACKFVNKAFAKKFLEENPWKGAKIVRVRRRL